MPTRDEFIARRPALTANITAYFGAGKTLQAHSFPKCYTISCDPAGLETLRQPRNASFLANLIEYEELQVGTKEELNEVFRSSATANERRSIYGCLARARELAEQGAIETLIIDGFTYFADIKWRQINEYEVAKSASTGNIDTQAMYRNLGLYLHRFVASDLMTMATRHQLNVILTTHLKRESEETVQGNAKIANRAKKVMTNSDIAPMIEGGFRNKLAGLVGADLYLEKTIQDGKTQYVALCDITRGFGTTVNAKNRYGLPARLPLTDGSLYAAIMDALKLKREQAAQPKTAPTTPTTTTTNDVNKQGTAKPTPTGASQGTAAATTATTK